MSLVQVIRNVGIYTKQKLLIIDSEKIRCKKMFKEKKVKKPSQLHSGLENKILQM